MASARVMDTHRKLIKVAMLNDDEKDQLQTGDKTLARTLLAIASGIALTTTAINKTNPQWKEVGWARVRFPSMLDAGRKK